MANLPEDVTEDLIRQRFEDVRRRPLHDQLLSALRGCYLYVQCGAIREVTISNKNGSLTASVEFVDRVSRASWFMYCYLLD